MTPVIDALLVLFAVALLVPSGVLLVECAAALVPDRKLRESSETNPDLRVVVLIPAYNESRVLRSTLQGIRSELRAADTVLVVADNCTDDTADIARAEGSNVIERFDSTHRGKGFALDCGVAHLAADPPDVVVVLDADCQVTPGSIHRLADCAVQRAKPVQAEDLITVPNGASPLA
jgi:cellulose synthase/poly-beta-1,6-N-acetylglucosamine synthase-like glycosyltransferase